jgi:hypothetical protein
MSIANLLEPNELTIYCAGINGFNNTLTSFEGIISETSGSTIVTTANVIVYTLPTVVNHSYDVEFTMTGICTSGTDLNLGCNLHTRSKIVNASNTGVGALLNYVADGNNDVSNRTAQVVTIVGNNVNFGITTDGTAGANGFWLWQWDIKVVSN